jgi:hypothetical protein
VRTVPPTLDAMHAVGPAAVVACLAMPKHAAGFCTAIAIFVNPSVANIAKYSDLKISSGPRRDQFLADEVVGSAV